MAGNLSNITVDFWIGFRREPDFPRLENMGRQLGCGEESMTRECFWLMGNAGR